MNNENKFSFDYWLKKIKNVFKSKVDRPSTSSNEDQKLKSLLNNIDLKDHLNNALIVPEIEKEYINSIKNIFGFGFHKGVYSIKDDLNENTKIIIESNAEKLYDLSNIILAGKLATLSTEIKSNEDSLQKNAKKVEEQNEVCNYLMHLKQFYPSSFSSLWFFFYLFISIALIIADLPLSLRLVQLGLNLPTGKPDLHDLFKVGSFLNVCRNNWEVILTSIGISLSTVYIKIYYDEFIGNHYGHKTISRIKFNKLFNSEEDLSFHDSLNKEDKKKVKWKTVIFLYTLLTFLVLGVFRSTTNNKSLLLNGAHSSDILTYITFILLTFLFPVISGICLSISLRIFQNLLSYFSSFSKKKKLEKVNEYLLRKSNLSKEQFNNLKTMTEQWNDKNDRVRKFVAMLFAYYWQGYYSGLPEADTTTIALSLFERVEAGRNKYVSKKINSIIAKPI